MRPSAAARFGCRCTTGSMVLAKIDPSKYDGMEPLYTEYNVGHFSRSFTLSNKIDQQQISAKLEDGILTLILKKVKEATPRRISIG